MSTSVQEPSRQRLYFICVPRSGSTSILKCLSFVKGMEAWFEPFVIARIARKEFKRRTGKELPTDWSSDKAAEFDKAAEYVQTVNKMAPVAGKKYAYSEVKKAIDSSTSSSIVVKDMGTSFRDRTQYLPPVESGFRYVFIIRDPYLSIASYKRASMGVWAKLGTFNERDAADFDVFKDDPYYRISGGLFKVLHSVWRHVRDNLDPDPLVIDMGDFLVDPRSFLKKICEVGGIEFHEELLEWDASPDIVLSWKNTCGVPMILQDNLSDFHKTAISSSCFMKQTTRKQRPPLTSLGEDVNTAASEGMEYYNEMHEHRFLP